MQAVHHPVDMWNEDLTRLYVVRVRAAQAVGDAGGLASEITSNIHA
jgi:hypothetical protein